jgi:hypothetical protein
MSQGFSVKTETYRDIKNKSKLAVLILPPTGGVNRIDKSYAKKLCKHDINAYILTDWTGIEERANDLGIHQRHNERAIRAIELVSNSIPESKIGLLGTSVGGIHAALAIGILGNISSAFIITGGAPLSGIIANSTQEELALLRAERMKKYGFRTTTDYELALEREIPWDPIKTMDHLEDKRLGVVIAMDDDVVPTRYQEFLAQFWAPNYVLRLKGTHASVILKTWAYHSDKVIQFFKNK